MEDAAGSHTDRLPHREPWLRGGTCIILSCHAQDAVHRGLQLAGLEQILLRDPTYHLQLLPCGLKILAFSAQTLHIELGLRGEALPLKAVCTSENNAAYAAMLPS